MFNQRRIKMQYVIGILATIWLLLGINVLANADENRVIIEKLKGY